MENGGSPFVTFSEFLLSDPLGEALGRFDVNQYLLIGAYLMRPKTQALGSRAAQLR